MHQSNLSSASAASSTAMPTVTVLRQEDQIDASLGATPHWVRYYCLRIHGNTVPRVLCNHLNNYSLFDVKLYSFHHCHTNTLIGMRLQTMILWDRSYTPHASESSPKKQCTHPQQKMLHLLEFYQLVKELKTTGIRWKTGKMLR